MVITYIHCTVTKLSCTNPLISDHKGTQRHHNWESYHIIIGKWTISRDVTRSGLCCDTTDYQYLSARPKMSTLSFKRVISLAHSHHIFNMEPHTVFYEVQFIEELTAICFGIKVIFICTWFMHIYLMCKWLHYSCQMCNSSVWLTQDVYFIEHRTPIQLVMYMIYWVYIKFKWWFISNGMGFINKDFII